MNVGIRKHGDMNYLIWDEVYLRSFLNFGIREEILRAELTDLKL